MLLLPLLHKKFGHKAFQERRFLDNAVLFIYLSHFIILRQPSPVVSSQRTSIFIFFFSLCAQDVLTSLIRLKQGFSEGANLYSFLVILSLQADPRYKGNRNIKAARTTKAHLCRNLQMLPMREQNLLSPGS